MMLHRPSRAALVALALACAPLVDAAYPDKPVRIVVTAPPAGPIDYLVRAIAPGGDLIRSANIVLG